LQAPTKYVLSAAILTGAFVPAAAAFYGTAKPFFNKTFAVTFDLGSNHQLIAGYSNVELRFYVSDEGTVFFYPASTEKTGCFANRRSPIQTQVNQSTTTSRECDGMTDMTTSRVDVLGDILTYTETQSVTSWATRRKLTVRRGYSLRFNGSSCEALRYIVEGIAMAPVSCQVADGNTAG